MVSVQVCILPRKLLAGGGCSAPHTRFSYPVDTWDAEEASTLWEDDAAECFGKSREGRGIMGVWQVGNWGG